MRSVTLRLAASLCVVAIFAATRVCANERAFLGAYVRFSQLFDGVVDDTQRAAAIDKMLDRFRDSGLKVVMPYVTTTSGSAAYPSSIVADRIYDDWDPLAYLISVSARAIRPGLQIALYSWGPHVANDHLVAQAWPVWSREGYIDMVNISGYCYPDNYGAKYLDVFSRR